MHVYCRCTEFPLITTLQGVHQVSNNSWMFISIDILAMPNNDVNHFICVLQVHKTDDTKIFKARDNRNVALHYDRILFCFDLEATDGNNVFAMLIGRNQNAYIFSGSFDQRDTRTFGKYITCIILSTLYILT